MTSRESKFRQAAWTYFGYGILYMAGAMYLESQGIGARGMIGGTRTVIWFLLGALIILLFPWLISKGAQGRGYLWFTRILALLVAFRAFEVGRIALRGSAFTMPAIGGGISPTRMGTWAFFLITLVTLIMLARAAWSRE